MLRWTLPIALLLAPLPVVAQSLADRVAVRLAQAGQGARFGLLVVDPDGRELVAVNPAQRFIPASNTKIVTTAAAYATLDSIDRADPQGGTRVRLSPRDQGPPDVVIEGRGDPFLSSAEDCRRDCLTELADAVAARVRVVGDVVGDASWFPDERWSPGMSWNNIPTRSGTAVAALSIDDNELALTVTPGKSGEPPVISGYGYFKLDNRVTTVATGETAIGFDRAPNSRLVRLTGTIRADAAPEKLRLAIDDPAHFAAWRLRAILAARGVKVMGQVRSRYRPLDVGDDPRARGKTPPPRPPEEAALAVLALPRIAEDVVAINKVSQNLHAELLLRRVGRVAGTGSIADGQVKVAAMMARAGAEPTAYALSDGSGMSTYNRLSPRATVALLRWIAAQPWGSAWRDSLPVGGSDGTLARRFRGTPLEGRVFAKTGTLNATNALSGYLIARSGRMLTFSSFANDVPEPEGVAAAAAIDAALVEIAEAM